MKWIGTLKQISRTATNRVGKTAGRSLHITGASCLGNLAVGMGKLLMGILSLSFFTCASALYTFFMVTAKCFALAGIVKEEQAEGQFRYYRASGLILMGASMLYIIYSIRLFITPVQDQYDMNTALLIATFTFAELAINIRGVIIERHSHAPLIHAIKMINLASSMICLVLTQAALLSIAATKNENHSTANGFIGVVMGSAALFLGAIMLVRIKKLQSMKESSKFHGQMT